MNGCARLILSVFLLSSLGYGKVCDDASGTALDAGLGHDSFSLAYRSPFGAVPARAGTVSLRFRACRGDTREGWLRVRNGSGRDAWRRMEEDGEASDPLLGPVRFFRAELPVPEKPGVLHYVFQARGAKGSRCYANRDGFHPGGWGAPYDCARDRAGYAITVYDPAFEVPAWLREAVIYQIFPDRFRNGDPTNDPPPGGGWIYGQKVRRRAWNEPICNPRGTACPGEFSNQFYGGDLAGITEKLDYLSSLGVTAIYLNPIFHAASNHRYDTRDYHAIDPWLGDDAAFRQLAAQARSRGMRIILDGVFNHSSSDSPYFDLYSRWDAVGACESTESPYRGWYYFPDIGSPGSRKVGAKREPVRCPRPELLAPGEKALTFEAYGGSSAMPRFRTREKAVQDFFFSGGPGSVGPFWLAAGASGWRLDVGGAVDSSFWRGMRRAHRAQDPESVLIGEEWGDASRWLLGDQWDSSMNYRFYSAVLHWMFDGCRGNGCRDGVEFSDANANQWSVIGALHAIGESDLLARLRGIEEAYPHDAWLAMMNLLGSHDTNRILFLLKKISRDDPAAAKRKLRFLALFAYTYPGSPTIYYGDEAGLAPDGFWDGGKWQGDPYNRAAYPWADQGLSPDEELIAWYRKLARSRPRGDYEPLIADDSRHVLAFRRGTALVALNRREARETVELPAGAEAYRDALTGKVFHAAEGRLRVAIEGLSGVILAPR